MPVQARTLTEQIARTREYVYDNDSANAIYTDAQVTEAINSGQELLSNLLSYSANHENVKISYAISTTTGESYLQISNVSNFARFKKVVSCGIAYPPNYGIYIPAIQVKPEEYPSRFSKGTLKDPTFFIGDSGFTSSVVLFYPVNPGGVLVMNLLYLRGYTRLTTCSETITVQDRYLDLLTLASAMNLLTWDNQTTRAAAIKSSLTDQISIENNSMINSNVIERVSVGGK